MRDIVNTPCHLRMVHIGPSKGPEDESGSRPSATHDRVDLLLRGDSADPAPPTSSRCSPASTRRCS